MHKLQTITVMEWEIVIGDLQSANSAELFPSSPLPEHLFCSLLSHMWPSSCAVTHKARCVPAGVTMTDKRSSLRGMVLWAYGMCSCREPHAQKRASCLGLMLCGHRLEIINKFFSLSLCFINEIQWDDGAWSRAWIHVSPAAPPPTASSSPSDLFLASCSLRCLSPDL